MYVSGVGTDPRDGRQVRMSFNLLLGRGRILFITNFNLPECVFY